MVDISDFKKWVDGRDPSGTYIYKSVLGCALQQYLSEKLGEKAHVTVRTGSWSARNGIKGGLVSPELDKALANAELLPKSSLDIEFFQSISESGQTFGALSQRLAELIEA